MALFATYKELSSITESFDTKTLIKEASETTGKTVFLSHSSNDHDLVPGVITVLQNHGARVYVDDIDSALPQRDFTETAKRLRNAVRACQRFVLLVTPRTKESKWIPWELGLGDGRRDAGNVALFPSAETSTEQQWAEEEYLGLYRRIVWGHFENQEPEWLVLDHRSNTATRIRAWLTGGGAG